MSDNPKPPQCCLDAANSLNAELERRLTSRIYSMTLEDGAAIIAEKTHMAKTVDLLKQNRTALYHDTPGSCWATGPLTGDAVEDLIVCPGCRAIAQITTHLAKLEGTT